MRTPIPIRTRVAVIAGTAVVAVAGVSGLALASGDEDRPSAAGDLSSSSTAELPAVTIDETGDTVAVVTLPPVATSGVTAPSVSTTDISVPDVSVPDVSAPDDSAPDDSAPDVSAPDVSAPNATTSGAGEQRTVITAGGTIVASFDGTTVALVSVTPAAGWTADIGQRLGDEVKVRFRAGSSKVEVELEAEDGRLVEEVEAKLRGDDDDRGGRDDDDGDHSERDRGGGDDDGDHSGRGRGGGDDD
jgi:hypothetical protein